MSGCTGKIIAAASSVKRGIDPIMPHRIEAYRFGLISVDGFTHGKDLIVLHDRVIENWRRSEGHHLCADDLRSFLDPEDIQELVVGTGKFGVMKVDNDVSIYLDQRSIKLHAMPTSEAVEFYNQKEIENIRVAGAFHLTC